MNTAEEHIKSLEAELATYKTSGPVALYYEVNRLVNETVAQVKTMSIKSDTAAKDAKADRIAALLEDAKKHIKWMMEIKKELKLSGDEKTDKDKHDVPFSERIADERE